MANLVEVLPRERERLGKSVLAAIGSVRGHEGASQAGRSSCTNESKSTALDDSALDLVERSAGRLYDTGSESGVLPLCSPSRLLPAADAARDLPSAEGDRCAVRDRFAACAGVAVVRCCGVALHGRSAAVNASATQRPYRLGDQPRSMTRSWKSSAEL